MNRSRGPACAQRLLEDLQQGSAPRCRVPAGEASDMTGYCSYAAHRSGAIGNAKLVALSRLP